MKTLLNRFWTEPAVALTVLSAIGILVTKLLAHDLNGADDVLQILAPVLAGVGIRGVVRPTATEGEFVE
jgi:hypothetical protein